VPLIAWLVRDDATASAEVASKARRRAVKVSSIGAGAPPSFKIFDQSLSGALLGYLPYAETAARKLEERRLKLMRNADAVLAVVGAADERAAATAGRDMTSNLRKLYGGGSIVSAMQYLAGKDAADILARVLDGELECSDGQTPERLAQAVAVARLNPPVSRPA
jgi:hypothetical protein